MHLLKKINNFESTFRIHFKRHANGISLELNDSIQTLNFRLNRVVGILRLF